MAIDRCDIEVRTELLLSCFFRFTDENLAAKTDDGLVSATVSISLEAVAVHAHHLRDVFFIPENIVVEVAVAVESCLLCNLWGADGTVPHKRWNIIEREWGGGITLQWGAEFSFPGDILLAPKTTQQMVIFNRKRDTFADVLAKPWVDLTMVLGPFENTRAKALFCSSYSARDGMNTISLPITRRTKVMTAAKVITFMLSFSPHTSTMTLEIRNTIQLMVWPPSENVTPVPQERDFMQNTFIARVTAA